MFKKQLSLPRGVRDLDATYLFKRDYLTRTILSVYRKYGCFPLETPALEHLTTLQGKYGNEGEKLLFKILMSGHRLIEASDEAIDYTDLLPKIVDKGLRYDLTVPLMRYVSMHRHKLMYPFKRYQIQPVWRADRPQRGRYREFHQCDVDMVGTSSLLCEAEILAMISEVLGKLGVTHFVIPINHRAILQRLATLSGAGDKVQALGITLDKLEKIGIDAVLRDLRLQGFSTTALDKLMFIFELPVEQEARWELLNARLGEDSSGIQELKQVFQYATALGMDTSALSIAPTLARGLSYYTGTIFEVKISNLGGGSIGGGGRYTLPLYHPSEDRLTGVGFSFGLDRLILALEALALFPASLGHTLKVLFTHSEDVDAHWPLSLLTAVRYHGICAEMYGEPTKLKKQLYYAHKKKIPFVAISTPEAKEVHKVILKNMHTGQQEWCTLSELLQNLT